MPLAIVNYYAFMEISAPVALIVHVIVCSLLALQFVAVGWLLRFMPRGRWETIGLRTAACWCVVEVLLYRPFPWFIGSAFLAISPVAQIADIAGVVAVSFVTLWGAGLVVGPADRSQRLLRLFVALSIVLFVGGYWVERQQQIAAAIKASPSVNIGIVQGNDPILIHPTDDEISAKLDTYLRLSAGLSPQPDILIWPEGPNLRLIDSETKNFSPSFDIGAPAIRRPLIFGSHTALSPMGAPGFRYQVSTLLLTPSGNLSIHYHKRMTLPLAEDIPFKKLFPWLTSIFGERYFVPGVAGTPIVVNRPPNRGGKVSGAPITAASVICYEDLVPNLLQELVRDTGASILVGLLNGQWFGQSVAVHQHALLASWRAIENGRYFVRASTTGLTRVVDPHGRVVAELPPFREGALSVPAVPLLTGKTIYTWVGMLPAQVISLVLLLLACLCYFRVWSTESSR